MSRLTGQSLDHEKPSCELPGAVAPVSATTNWWKAKNFSFSFDFFQNQVTLDCDLQAPSQKNDERLAGQVAHLLHIFRPEYRVILQSDVWFFSTHEETF
jgi:hypothetical protein